MPLVPVGVFHGYHTPVTVSGAGYIAGGVTPTSSGFDVATVDKLTFSTATISALASGLNTATGNDGGGLSDNGTAGYVSSGNATGGTTVSGTKYAYSTDTRSAITQIISAVSYGFSCTYNKGVAGYYLGGTAASGLYQADKFSFSTNTVSVISINSSTTYYSTGVSNNAVAGYSRAGTKISFVTETANSIAVWGTASPYLCAGVMNNGVAGYASGGTISSGRNGALDKLEFSTETYTTMASKMINVREYVGGFGNNQVAGYVAGGSDSGGTMYNAIEQILFPSDTVSVMSAVLSSAKIKTDCFQNSGVI